MRALHNMMIKLLILVIIIIFIILPLYQGESVSNIAKNISQTIETIRASTPPWVKSLIARVFSIAFRIVRAMFNAAINVIFDEAKRGTNEKLDQEKDKIQKGDFDNLGGALQKVFEK